MGFGEILGKALVVVKGDTSHARGEIDKLSATEQRAARERLKHQEEMGKAFERGQQRFELYSAAVSTGWSVIAASVEKAREHYKKLGPEGESELKKIKDASDALTKAQDSLQLAIAKLAIEVAPLATKAFASMAETLASVGSSIGGIVARAKELDSLSGGALGSALDFALEYGGPVNQGGKAASWGLKQAERGVGAIRSGLGYSEDGVYTGSFNFEAYGARLAQEARVRAYDEGLGGILDTRLAQGRDTARRRAGGIIIGALDRIGTGFRAGWNEDAKPYGGAGGGFTLNAAEVGEENTSRITYYNQADKLLSWIKGGGLSELGDTALGYVEDFGNMDLAKEDPRAFGLRRAQQMADIKAQRESMLAGIFGPVSEFELYKTAWQGLEGVVTAGLNAWIDGSKSAGQAMKEALHGFAKQLAGEALLQALRHGAYALGSLAFGDAKSAAAHGISAAKWGAVAIAASAVGKFTAGSGASAGASGGYAAAGIGGGYASGGGGQTTTVIMTDSLGWQSKQTTAIKFREIERNARNRNPPPFGMSS